MLYYGDNLPHVRLFAKWGSVKRRRLKRWSTIIIPVPLHHAHPYLLFLSHDVRDINHPVFSLFAF